MVATELGDDTKTTIDIRTCAVCGVRGNSNHQFTGVSTEKTGGVGLVVESDEATGS